MPELASQRDLHVYLPPGYDSSAKSYPVLYMLDGQNLFNELTAFSGEWQVDETMEALFQAGKTEGIIVVGIENAGKNRRSEYSAWPVVFGEETLPANASKFLKFLTETLKPHIDANYRTQSSPSRTGIAGSSMGGIMSLYAGLQRPDVFGIVGAISPYMSRSAYGQQIEDYLKGVDPNLFPSASSRIYMDIGDAEIVQNENTEVLASVVSAHAIIENSLFPGNPANYRFEVIPDAIHKESAWRARFPDIVSWLYELE
ncbi:MAG: alpha/beta hydrolase [Pseudobacteriovorax sp.]|nr:alpha/beta hydrolase [Pseudobacteriovorax sp.]